MAHNPLASPSSPSSRLTRFNINKNQIIVTGMEKLPKYNSGPNGTLTTFMSTPNDIRITMDINCIDNFQPAFIPFMSSYIPPAKTGMAARKSGTRLKWAPKEKLERKNTKNRTAPPSIGMGLTCMDFCLG